LICDNTIRLTLGAVKYYTVDGCIVCDRTHEYDNLVRIIEPSPTTPTDTTPEQGSSNGETITPSGDVGVCGNSVCEMLEDFLCPTDCTVPVNETGGVDTGAGAEADGNITPPPQTSSNAYIFIAGILLVAGASYWYFTKKKGKKLW
jgi:LPXTG-motif cell wall-anchored protein